ncbi:hypothetical protein RMSM_05807 [Rhodopirellula maiorica SM1]|uniref:Uncharacterized protein n=1 Tax=Rhodopirellula maiorica SM1 TaxID=1265738 RepID=M5RTI9_9BACT|nr:hypothetical protein RMSM_05807 [Rhodopirellula maiorica SM1]
MVAKVDGIGLAPAEFAGDGLTDRRILSSSQFHGTNFASVGFVLVSRGP